MALILSLETSTSTCSVAVVKDGVPVSEHNLFLDKSHSGLLMPIIKDAIKYCGISFDDLDAVAVSKGPGSYTGLRIGVSAAKGLCYALGIPLVSVNTLEAMGLRILSMGCFDGLLCPMIDARRMEVYCLIMSGDGEVLEKTKARVVESSTFQEVLKSNKVYFFGNGADKCREIIVSPNAEFIDGNTNSAMEVGILAEKKYLNSEFEDLAYFEPYYLKEFVPIKPKAV